MFYLWEIILELQLKRNKENNNKIILLYINHIIISFIMYRSIIISNNVSYYLSRLFILFIVYSWYTIFLYRSIDNKLLTSKTMCYKLFTFILFI